MSLTGAARLAAVTKRGGITLVLGAGLSVAYGVPGWGTLVERLWKRAFRKRRPLPRMEGIPQFLPFALELIARELGPGAFLRALRGELYGKVRAPAAAEMLRSEGSLATLSRLLVQEHARGPERRIQRVITFNVDDLIEQSVWALAPNRRVLKTVVRASQHPERGLGDPPIALYHLHGFLPFSKTSAWHEEAPDCLVFTDAQYWGLVAEPLSFPNRVMSFALHDSRCVFIGLSMTDMNILRWLATRAVEIEDDKRGQFSRRTRKDAAAEARSERQALRRHFWLRPEGDDVTGFLTECLDLRGVSAVPVQAWHGPSFRTLVETCFPKSR